MSFVCQPSIVPPAPSTPETAIANDGFFPSVDLGKLRLQIRMADEVTPDRLREATIAAIITVGNDLDGWKAAQIAAGFATMASVPAVEIDGTSRLLLLYRRAVTALVRAELTERARDADVTPAGRANLDSREPGIDDLRRDARHAVRDILGRTRLSAELI